MSKLSDRIGQFVTVPVTVIKMFPVISSEAVKVFVYLRFKTNSKTDTAFPSYDLIQKDTNLSRRKIARSIRELMTAGLVERRRRFANSTVYTLVLPKRISSNGATNDSSNGATNDSSNGGTLSRKTTLERKGKKENSADEPRSDSQHPAIQAYRLKAKTYPDKAQYDTIIEAVGEAQEALEFWGRVVKAYIDLGWNKRNIGNMVGYFKRHEIPALNRNGNGNSKRRSEPDEQMRQDFEEWQRTHANST